jgi:hypothetical protein
MYPRFSLTTPVSSTNHWFTTIFKESTVKLRLEEITKAINLKPILLQQR